jgi:hypothetical protein
MIMGDYDSDENSNAQKLKDQEVPKPTVDVLMSRNLRSGKNKGFNFGGMDDSSDEQEEEVKELIKPSPPKKFGSLGKKFSLNVESEEETKVQKPPPKKFGLNL